jgi:class 3 adenylate cyclase
LQVQRLRQAEGEARDGPAVSVADLVGVTEVVEMDDEAVARSIEKIVATVVATIMSGQGFSVSH